VGKGHTLPYFLLGFSLGLAVGILFAPKSGAGTERTKPKGVRDKEFLRGVVVGGNLDYATEAGRQAGRQAYWEAATLPGESIPPPK